MNTNEQSQQPAETPLKMPPEAPPEVRELTAAQWAQWRHHPVTRAFRRYLADYRASLISLHLDRFLNGRDNPVLENETRAKAGVVIDVLSLPFDAIAMFYAPQGEVESIEPWRDPFTEDIPSSVEQRAYFEANSAMKEEEV